LQALVEGCDQLIIPTTPDALALDALMLTVRALTTLGADRYRVLITMVPPKPSRDGDEARVMLAAAGIPVFATGIRRLVAFQKAALQGVPVTDVADPRALHGWDDYRVIGEGLQHGRQ
jgi:chromosome partitioning protein